MGYDVIVVGAGSAGCVLAARLSEDPGRRVLLVEAGPEYRPAELPPELADASAPAISHDWGYQAEPDRIGRRIPLPRARVVGGCGATNAAFALRGSPADYDWWAALGNPDWSFDLILPVFRRMEDDADFADEWHGKGGPVPIRRAWPQARTPLQAAFAAAATDLGHAEVADHNRPGAVGVGPGPRNVVDGVRVSTALAYLKPARDRPNLDVCSGTNVARVVVRDRRATGVELDRGVIHTDVVILAAGSYGSPAILMRSGVGDPATLETLGIRPAAELLGVGRGLMDHPLGAVLVPCAPPERPTPVFDSMLTWRSPFASAVAAPDVFLAAGGPFSVPSSPTGAAFVVSYAVLRPRSRGWLRLDSGDPYAAPRIHIGHLQDKLDVRRMIAGYHQAVELATSDRMARLGVGPVTAPPPEDGAAVERYVRETSGTFHHPVGTCRMGPDPAAGAVVDQHGRVHGVDALLVADASVMPHIPSAPTHLATIAVAERIAEWLSH